VFASRKTRVGYYIKLSSSALTSFSKDIDMSTSGNYRTTLVAALLDLLDFVEGKLREALDDPASQLAAATEAGCAMPLMLERLRQDEVIGATFELVLGTKLGRQYWRG
jgi:hypothetical protein